MKDLLQNLLKLQDLEFADVSDSATETAISKLRQKIPRPILEHYDRLTDRGKKGVAAVRHQVCMGCHMRIPMGAVITLMHATDIQTCDNCGRYLYLPSDAHNELSEVFEEARVTSVRSKPRHKPILPVA
jgi:predicted  nucleic acid-binding Zn-ribbon protein